MGLKKVSLKAQNMPLIIVFLIWSISLYVLFLSNINDFWVDLTNIFSAANAEKGILVTLAPLIAFILTNVIDANIKAILVFWRIKSPLPGTRAFSIIAPKDPRIDMNILRKKIKEIPSDPIEQNKTWYKIYKQVEDKISVISSQKNYLLARDISFLSFLFLILSPWSILFVKYNIKLFIIYIIIWLVQYLVISLVARNIGKQFVSNALAEYCCKE